MQSIKNRNDIEAKIAEIEERLERIEHSISEELKRPFFQRRAELCLFLDIERKVYTAMSQQLKWVLYE